LKLQRHVEIFKAHFHVWTSWLRIINTTLITITETNKSLNVFELDEQKEKLFALKYEIELVGEPRFIGFKCDARIEGLS
jgi:hypothetical protein